mgnify:CR=1 FL=1
MSTVIRFDQVSKRYRTGAGIYSLRGAVQLLVARAQRKDIGKGQELWALRNVSFRVEQGQSVGILGHNGAGKTTALKLLSGITTPTTGLVYVTGRLGSLIELGAGFHPEMTGRENVFLNGVIMGMSRREVKQRFDQIVAFSGVEEFIDMPVKRYSSGMYVRLAFAVAAHIDPAVLLVDEVLAVGDINYRAQCYRRMAELRRSGTTIILVSHSIQAIRDTCDRALLLWRGELLQDGEVEPVVTCYLEMMQAAGQGQFSAPGEKPSDPKETNHAPLDTGGKIDSVVFYNARKERIEKIDSGAPISIEIGYVLLRQLEKPIVRIDFIREGTLYVGFSTSYDQMQVAGHTGPGMVRLDIKALHLPPGVYAVTIVLADGYEFARGEIVRFIDFPTLLWWQEATKGGEGFDKVEIDRTNGNRQEWQDKVLFGMACDATQENEDFARRLVKFLAKGGYIDKYR